MILPSDLLAEQGRAEWGALGCRCWSCWSSSPVSRPEGAAEPCRPDMHGWKETKYLPEPTKTCHISRQSYMLWKGWLRSKENGNWDPAAAGRGHWAAAAAWLWAPHRSGTAGKSSRREMPLTLAELCWGQTWPQHVWGLLCLRSPMHTLSRCINFLKCTSKTTASDAL